MSFLDRLLGKKCPTLEGIKAVKQQVSDERQTALAELREALARRKSEPEHQYTNGHLKAGAD